MRLDTMYTPKPHIEELIILLDNSLVFKIARKNNWPRGKPYKRKYSDCWAPSDIPSVYPVGLREL
jgi:hypothetical protein